MVNVRTHKKYSTGAGSVTVRNRIIRGRIGTLFCAMQIRICGMVLIIEVDRSKLGMDGDGVVDVLNVKCDPTIIGMVRMQAESIRHTI